MKRMIGWGVSLLWLVGGVASAQPAAGGGRHVRASLVPETDAVRPGQALLVGFRLQMEPGWHTYWRNPGDAGLPTKARWELPEGFSAGEIQWPRPIRFLTGPVVSYGYEHDVLLPVEITVPASIGSREARLSARLSWLECRDVCLPGKADLELVLPVRPNASAGDSLPLFAEARRQLPRRDAAWRVSATAGEGTIALGVRPPRGVTVSEAYFYPLARRVLDYSKPQALGSAGAGYRLELPRDPNGQPTLERLDGVLVATTPAGTVALEVDVAVEARAASRKPRPTTTLQEKNP